MLTGSLNHCSSSEMLGFRNCSTFREVRFFPFWRRAGCLRWPHGSQWRPHFFQKKTVRRLAASPCGPLRQPHCRALYGGQGRAIARSLFAFLSFPSFPSFPLSLLAAHPCRWRARRACCASPPSARGGGRAADRARRASALLRARRQAANTSAAELLC